MKCCSITKYEDTTKPFIKDVAGLGEEGADRAYVFSLFASAPLSYSADLLLLAY